MNRTTRVKLAVDALMLAGILLAMANKLTENRIHELIGAVVMVGLFIVHNALNRQWHASLRQRWQSNRGRFDIVVNILLTLAIGILIGSSIMLSRSIFAVVAGEGNLTLRQIHSTAAQWFLILMAVHLGVQWARMAALLRKMIPLPHRYRVPGPVRMLVPAAILGYGIKASFDRDICSKLFMIYSFDFWDFEQSSAGFFVNYLAIIGVYAVITSTALKALSSGTTVRQEQRAGTSGTGGRRPWHLVTTGLCTSNKPPSPEGNDRERTPCACHSPH